MKLCDDNDAKEFNKAFNRSYVLHWLNGDKVYHEGVCYVFPHGKQHIVKILKEIFSEQHTKDYHKIEGRTE